MSRLEKVSYSSLVTESRPGDILAFSGRGPISLVIEVATWSRISHVGVLYNPVTLCEVTNLRSSTPQVSKRSVAEVLDSYLDGTVYYLPLDERYTSQETDKELQDWLDEIEEKKIKYDYWQAGLSVVPFRVVKEHFGRLFCSELDARSIEIKCKVDLHCSRVRPKDVISFNIYSDTYYCIKGNPTPLKKFNSVNIEGFNR